MSKEAKRYEALQKRAEERGMVVAVCLIPTPPEGVPFRPYVQFTPSHGLGGDLDEIEGILESWEKVPFGRPRPNLIEQEPAA